MIELIPSHKSPEVVKPTDRSLNFPPSLVSPERSAVLRRRLFSIGFVGSNQFGPTFFQTRAQRIAIRGFVIDQLARPPANDSVGEQRLDEINFVRAGTFNQVAARRTTAVGQQHNLGALAAFGLAYAKAPFFADENVPSAIDSSRSTLPWWSSLFTRRAQAFLNSPASDHCFNRRQHVGYEGKCGGRSRQRAPVRSTHAMASKQSREDALGRPPAGDGGGSSNKSEIKPHWSSVSSNSGSIMDPTLDSASAEWDLCDISLFPFENCTHKVSNGLI